MIVRFENIFRFFIYNNGKIYDNIKLHSWKVKIHTLAMQEIISLFIELWNAFIDETVLNDCNILNIASFFRFFHVALPNISVFHLQMYNKCDNRYILLFWWCLWVYKSFFTSMFF